MPQLDFINTCYETTNAVRSLAMYSHLLPAFIILILGIFSYRFSLNVARSTVFLIFTITLSLWLLSDLVLWSFNNYSIVAMFWSFLDFLNILFYFLLVLFLYLDYKKYEKIPLHAGLILFILLLIPLFYTLSGLSVIYFDESNCEMAVNDVIINYKFFAGILSMLTIGLLGVVHFFKTKHGVISRGKIVLLSISSIIFIGIFSGSELLSNITGVYETSLYALFSLPVFILILTYSIIEQQTLDIQVNRYSFAKLLFTIFILVASFSLFLADNIYEFGTIGISALVTAGFGLLSLRSARKESLQREEIQTLAESLQKANQTMYGHSHELAISNKTQAFIAQLYKISTLTLTQKQLAEQVVVALETEFEFEMVGIYQYTKETDTLIPLAVMMSDRVTSAATTTFDSLQFTRASKHSFLSTLIERETMHYTEQLTDIWQQTEMAETCARIEAKKFVRSSLAYPLIIGQQVIGVVLISLNRTYSDLVEYERDSMQNFMNVISITLNRVTLYEELELANKRQENLIHFITHEVKGYLTKSSAVFASISEGDFKDIPDSLTSLAGRALAETRKGVETVTNILEASNLKKGTIQYLEEPIDLKTIVNEAIASFEPIAKEKGLTITGHVSEDAYPFIGDGKKLSHHLIRNLIDNAIRYTPTGMINVRLSQNEKDYYFSVQDTGVGIDTEDIGKLFVEGGRAKDSVKVNVDSTGYGLFIAKMITEAHKGKIWVESPGHGLGSTFSVILPRMR